MGHIFTFIGLCWFGWHFFKGQLFVIKEADRQQRDYYSGRLTQARTGRKHKECNA